MVDVVNKQWDGEDDMVGDTECTTLFMPLDHHPKGRYIPRMSILPRF